MRKQIALNPKASLLIITKGSQSGRIISAPTVICSL